eukprot:1142328-Pelagomonas_calceolata.AAC.4
MFVACQISKRSLECGRSGRASPAMPFSACCSSHESSTGLKAALCGEAFCAGEVEVDRQNQAVKLSKIFQVGIRAGSLTSLYGGLRGVFAWAYHVAARNNLTCLDGMKPVWRVCGC